MQSVRMVLREVGIPDGKDILSSQDVSDYLEYQYLSKGYEIQATHYLGEVISPDPTNKGVVGYKVLFILVKEENPEPEIVGEAVEKVKAKK